VYIYIYMCVCIYIYIYIYIYVCIFMVCKESARVIFHGKMIRDKFYCNNVLIIMSNCTNIHVIYRSTFDSIKS